MEVVHRRKPASAREVRRTLATKTAAEAIGPLTHGCEIFGLSKGQYSLVDILVHCLDTTGPADVIVSTWTAAGADLGFAYKLLTEGRIRSIQFIVDFSFPTRQPQYCAALRERFGDHAIRITKTHAKFLLIRNAAWNIVIRSSMNLNENRRLESFEVSDDPALARYLQEVITELFQFQEPGEGFTKRPYDVCKDFERFGEDPAAVVADVDLQGSTDTRKYFSDDPFGPDIRRAGATYTK
jgi:hypothetical protein